MLTHTPARPDARMHAHTRAHPCAARCSQVRLDHARVVAMFRTEKALPLIKDYLGNVQKTNIAEVRCRTHSVCACVCFEGGRVVC